LCQDGFCLLRPQVIFDPLLILRQPTFLRSGPFFVVHRSDDRLALAVGGLQFRASIASRSLGCSHVLRLSAMDWSLGYTLIARFRPHSSPTSQVATKRQHPLPSSAPALKSCLTDWQPPLHPRSVASHPVPWWQARSNTSEKDLFCPGRLISIFVCVAPADIMASSAGTSRARDGLVPRPLGALLARDRHPDGSSMG